MTVTTSGTSQLLEEQKMCGKYSNGVGTYAEYKEES